MADTVSAGRPRAPTITVDTSNVHDTPDSTNNYISPVTGGPNASLAVPGGRERGNSVDSTTSGSTIVGSPTGKTAGHVVNVDRSDVWNPEDEAEGKLFQDENTPFGVTRGHLSKLIPRKDLVAFYQLKGMAGLEKALRTNIKTGLNADEEKISGKMSFEEVQLVNPADLDTKELASTDLSAEGDEKHNESKSSAFSDRKRVFGDNRLPERKSKNFFQLAWQAIQDKILILLCVAAVVSLALGIYQSTRPHKEGEGANIEWVEGVAILVAVAIVVFVGALNDWQKERQFKKLNEKKEDRLVKVIRSGVTQKVSVWDVFPGDVMILDQGDVVPVDGIFIEGHNVSCDESSATGESDLLKKTPGHLVWKALHEGQEIKKMDPFIISGAKVSEGVGTFLVTAVGVNSSHGKLMMALSEDNEATPLQFKLNRLASYIAKMGSSAGLLLFIVLFIEYATRLGAPDETTGEPKTPDQKAQGFINILIQAVTIIVVAVPEGLPLAVTLALAFATKRMTKDNNLVRHLQSCETMGNATVICSDKTGTLTQNVMTVVAVTFGRGNIRCGDKDRLPAGEAEKAAEIVDNKNPTLANEGNVEFPIHELHNRMNSENQLLLKESIAINSTAFEGEENGKKAFIGSKTETALLDFAERCFGLGSLQKERESLDIVQLIPFDSGKKCMGVVIRQNNNYRLFIKGASEIVLSRCSKVLEDPLASSAVTDLSENDKQALNKLIFSYASMSLRTIGMAYRDFAQWPPQGARTSDENPKDAVFDDINKDLTWLAVTGIQDPVRNGVPEAVKTCERAGVRVIMVTGDNVETARAIAQDCGILKEGGEVIQGPQFRKLSQVELQELLPKLCVIARSSPEDKKFLVNSFKAEGHVVAVTGDGTNDAPALKAADVGFSMGITGTEVAKEASDIILMDDNFSSIVKALAWGRTINDAVKKFLQFQLTVNIVAVIVTFVTAVASEDESAVLNAVQLLWINLIMDTFAALALATDPPAGSLLDRKPEPRGSALISVTMWKTIIGQSIYQLIVIMVMYFVGRNNPRFIPRDSPRQFSTLVFNTFTWMQIFDAVNCRRIDNKLNIFEGFWKNRFFMGIILIMIGGQVLIVSVGGAAFAVTQNSGKQWAIAIVIGFITLPIGVLIRYIPDSWAIAAARPILAALAILIPKPIKNWWARRRARKAAKAITTEAPKGKEDDPEFNGAWGRVSQQVYDDLSLYKRIRGRRLHNIKTRIRNPKTVFQRSRAGSRSVLPALVAPGAMAGSVGGGISPSNRSINTLPKSVEDAV